MDTLAPEISNLILDLAALDRPSLIHLSGVSKFFRRRLAPQIFSKLVIKNVSRGDNFDAVCDRIERLLKFIKTSEWTVCVESISFEIRFPKLEKLRESSPGFSDMEVSEIVTSSSTWFPPRLTYILSSLSSLFPALHTLELSFPNTMMDCDHTFEVLLTGTPDNVADDSDHHVLIKLLDLTFEAIAQNGPEEHLEQSEIESKSSDMKQSSHQRIKHFSVSECPPFGCDALQSPRFRTFLSNVVSFSLAMDDSFNLDEGAYFNEQLQPFLSQTIPDSFLSHFYGNTCLENLRLGALSSCPFGGTELLPFEPQRMGSLKRLVFVSGLLSELNTISETTGFGAFIKANTSTLEEIQLISVGWFAEEGNFEQDSADHWGSFFAFLREHQPTNLRRLCVESHVIGRQSQIPQAELPKDLDLGYEYLDYGYGYISVDISDEEEIPDFRREGDFNEWVLLRNSILGN